MSVLRAALLGVACMLCAGTAWAAAAQENAGQPALFANPSLRQAVRSVWDGSPDVQVARAELNAAQARARAAAQPLYNPTLALDAENADVNRRTMGLSLALDLSGKRRARSEQGSAQLQASQAGYDLLRRDVATRWLKAWSTLSLAAEQRQLGERRVELMRRFDELAAQRLKVGDISSPERDLAGLALGEAQIQQASLVGNEAAAMATLASISPDAATSAGNLPNALPPASATIAPRAFDDYPELVRARALQAGAEAGVQVAQRARMPDPTVSLTGGQVRSGPVNDRVIGVSVSIPLPVLNTGRAEVDAARAEADAASAGVHAQQLAAKARLREAQARYDALLGAAQAFRISRAAAFDERTALLEKLWRAGELGTSDYLVQLKQSLDTALSGLDLQAQAWQAWFDYLSAAGRLTDWIDGGNKDASP
ncbi:TolC family protein [Dyella marensis]|uniref:TolC family protein n=1 Tax=Dyella marensis TaxID=500610 RepID=UPI0031DC519E